MKSHAAGGYTVTMRPFLPGDIIEYYTPDDDVPPMLVLSTGETHWDEGRCIHLVEISTVDMGRTKVLTHQINPELFRVAAR